MTGTTELATEADEVIGRIALWAGRNDDLMAAFVVGSRARTNRPADEWSDVDIILVTRDPAPYLADGEWLRAFGDPVVTFTEQTALGDQYERRVLFDSGLDADFVIISADAVNEEMLAAFSHIALRGIRVLFDREGILEGLSGRAEDAPRGGLPEERDVMNLMHDFLYHSLWAARKLARGELWTAKACVDCYLKGLLLTLVRWHALAEKGPEHDTWHEGRFLEVWADPSIVAGLPRVFAHYDTQDVARALRSTMELFRDVAIEAAEALRVAYPAEADRFVSRLVDDCLSRIGRSPKSV